MRRHRCLFSIILCAATSPGAGSAGAVTIGAPSLTVGVADTFAIDLSITDAVELGAWQFDLAFDPTIVTANSVAEGPFFASFSALGFTSFIPGVIDNGSGLISLVAGFYSDLPSLPSGDGVLATVEFTSLAVGTSPLQFSSVFLGGFDFGFDVVHGEITVTADGDGGGGDGGGNGGGGHGHGGNGNEVTVPEPSTASLLLLPALALVLSRLRRQAGCHAGGGPRASQHHDDH